MDSWRLASFYRTTFPQAFRSTFAFTFAAFLLTLIPGFVCFRDRQPLPVQALDCLMPLPTALLGGDTISG